MTADLPPGSIGQLHPDEFMFRQFQRHSSILQMPQRSTYFMLSSGANYLPMSDVWRELLKLELDHDFAYQWYTSARGFPSLTRAAQFSENTIAHGRVRQGTTSLGEVCMTLGASQAVAAVYDFLATHRQSPRVLLLGLNYSLFERLARHYQVMLKQMVSDRPSPVTLPSVSSIRSALAEFQPHLVVLTIPNNPSGELFSSADLSEILITCRTQNALVLIDKVGQLPISYDPWINIGRMILSHDLQTHVIQVNSFSKTDSIPGFRVGYIIGPQEIINHVQLYQHISLMNPPTVPILPVYFSFMARTMFALSGDDASSFNDDYLTRFFSHLFSITTAIAPRSLVNQFNAILRATGETSPYRRYIDSQLGHWQDIQRNYEYLRYGLGSFIVAQSDFQAGFNLLIQLEPFAGRDEDDVCQKVLNATGIALLSESCFIKRASRRRNFWIRVSLAAPPNMFCPAIDRFRHFLSKKGH